jgi:aminoglycoside phosphotransferase (APT) family kinase protein
VRAVLDWEVAHIGDPAEDLAWISTPPWRFGELDRPVGGLGSRQQLFQAYEAASGERVDPARVHYWEVLGSLRWGVSCASMLDWFTSGRDPSVERAMIARRVSENELDLMRILTGTD